MTETLPPHNLEAEKNLLGCIFADEITGDRTVLAEMAAMVQPFHFYRGEHQKIYKLMLEIYNQDNPINLVSLFEEVEARELNISATTLTELSNLVPTAHNWKYYAGVVIDKYVRRSLRTAGIKIASLSENGEISSDEALGRAQQIIHESTNLETENNSYSMADLYEIFAEDLSEREPGKETGISTGFSDLDYHINGQLRGGDYIIIGARPSMGKTALVLNILLKAAAKGIPGHFFSLEMSKLKLYERMVSIVTRIPHTKIVRGGLSPEERQIRDKAMRWMMGLPLQITEKVFDINQIWSLARRSKLVKGTKIIGIDYLQMIKNPLGKEANDNQVVTEISRQAKNMASSLDVPLLMLSQLSRNLESRTNKVPQLSDLRGSGSLEQDGDHIWFLYRDEYYNPNTEKKNICEIHIAKQRDGTRGVAQDLYFDPTTGCFNELSRRYDQRLRYCI